MERETKTNVEMKRETKTNAERANAFLTYVTPTIEQISRLRDVALDYTNKTKKAIKLLMDVSNQNCFEDNEIPEEDFSKWDEFRVEMQDFIFFHTSMGMNRLKLCPKHKGSGFCLATKQNIRKISQTSVSTLVILSM